ncbi:hypothetical protein [Streptomyces sp. NPDC057690]|uniref:hypothetical protein n=1 Tax=Streptomyces sp. NPDC057690 TaxID=3346214 RepID=UPI00368BCBA9
MTGEDIRLGIALASVVIKDNVQGPLHRVGPPRDSRAVVAPCTGGDILLGRARVRRHLAARYERGAHFRVQPGSTPVPPAPDLLLVVRADGLPAPVTGTRTVTPLPGDTAVPMGSV